MLTQSPWDIYNEENRHLQYHNPIYRHNQITNTLNALYTLNLKNKMSRLFFSSYSLLSSSFGHWPTKCRLSHNFPLDQLVLKLTLTKI